MKKCKNKKCCKISYKNYGLKYFETHLKPIIIKLAGNQWNSPIYNINDYVNDGWLKFEECKKKFEPQKNLFIATQFKNYFALCFKNLYINKNERYVNKIKVFERKFDKDIGELE